MDLTKRLALVVIALGAMLVHVNSRASVPVSYINFRADDKVTIWADGDFLLTVHNWQTEGYATFAHTTQVLAFELEDTHYIIAGFIASLSNGMVTNDNGAWRCTSTTPRGIAWKLPGFDDSGWEVPIEMGDNGDAPWGDIPDVAAHAKWIWLRDWIRNRKIYCRLVVNLKINFRADDKVTMWRDGVFLASLSNWQIPGAALFPGNTRVLAFELEDIAYIIASFIASISNGVVTNDNGDWRCTSIAPIGNAWKLAGFNDDSWEVPEVYGHNGAAPWGPIPDVAINAKWIWLSDWRLNRKIYCRLDLD